MRTTATDVKAARLAKKLTQAELAERAGVSAGTVANVEAGKNCPRTKTLEAIYRALGKPVPWQQT